VLFDGHGPSDHRCIVCYLQTLRWQPGAIALPDESEGNFKNCG